MKTKETAFRGALSCVWMELSEDLVTGYFRVEVA